MVVRKIQNPADRNRTAEFDAGNWTYRVNFTLLVQSNEEFYRLKARR